MNNIQAVPLLKRSVRMEPYSESRLAVTAYRLEQFCGHSKLWIAK